jgi:catechol 2,3-dioxygenase-like lactoylglutathione lyase family enzyme
MTTRQAAVGATNVELGPPQFQSFSHVSVPCRDLDEGIRFYTGVMGGKLEVHVSDFAYIRIAGIHVGIGSEAYTVIERSKEYPHMAFYAGPEAIVRMHQWLSQCGIPSSNLWTRGGVEALMFFRDPTGNLIELYCQEGLVGADTLPHGPARGHGITVDIDALYYDTWSLPAGRLP